MADASVGRRAAQKPALAPVQPGERVAYIDTLRGFALLGILVPNVLTFAWPINWVTYHPYLPETDASELGLWVHDIFFLGKFMFLFSMLFGVGVYVWDRKTQDGGLARGSKRWYTRCAWLLLFGFLHGWILWFGDILLMYAISGMAAVWWLRRLRRYWSVPGSTPWA